MKQTTNAVLVIAMLLTLGACSSSDSSSGNIGSSNTGDTLEVDSATFPTELAVASPTDLSDTHFEVSSNRFVATSSQRLKTFSSRSPSSGYSAAIERIDEVFAGDVAVRDTFTPELFYSQGRDADCYGPKLFYENHVDGPDGSPQGSDAYPSLPTGDLGIWIETEQGDEACVAAQLTARMKDVKDRSFIALMGIASMIKVYTDAGNTWPDDISAGSSASVLDQMNELGIENTVFTRAEISLDSAGEQWAYAVDLTYTRDSVDYDISVNMTHVHDESSGTYEGLLTYTADHMFDPPGNCPDSDVTLNGSLHYLRNSDTDIRLQSRGVQMCGHSESALTEAVDSTNLTGNVVNPALSWANNYSQFTAEFDPSTLGGHYSYVWQAGKNDSHSRILNIGLEAVTAGEAYFGFGDPVDTTDGSILGFICNWAGPGNSHALADYAQRQHITLNSSTNVFEPSSSGASDIVYAPTVACTYDGSGSFLYDRDVDGDLSDEDSTTVNVGSGEVLAFDLMAPSGSETTIWGHITNNRGYDLPAYPN